MANSIDYNESYLGMLDQVNKIGLTTAILETSKLSVVFAADSAKVVYLNEAAVEGLGTYDRATGYPTGDWDITKTPYTMAVDRGKKFIFDALDEIQAQVKVLEMAAEFERVSVIPETDAYRFSKLVSLCSLDVSENLTYDTVLNAIDTGIAALDNAEAGTRRVLFVSPTVMQLMKASGALFTARIASEPSGIINRNITTFDGMPLIQVPQSRFKSAITLSATNGFSAAGGAKDMNFAIVDIDAVAAPVKYLSPKLIAPAFNADNDAYIFGYRKYHDLFVPNNKLGNVYLHSRA